MYFGYAIHKDGLLVSLGGRYAEEVKQVADGFGEWTGFTLTTKDSPGWSNFKDVKIEDVVALEARPSFFPPRPDSRSMAEFLWTNKTLVVKGIVSAYVVVLSENIVYPPTMQVRFRVDRKTTNTPPPPEEIAAEIAKFKADGAVLYRAEAPIVKELYQVKNDWLFDLKTNKPAVGIEKGFESEAKGLLGRVWSKVFGG